MIDATPGALFLALMAATPGPPDEGRRFAALADEVWEFRLREDPLLASSVGDRRYDDRLPSMTRDDIERRAAALGGFLERIREIRSEALPGGDRIDHALLERELREAIAEHEFGSWRMPLNADSGFHSGVALLPTQMPFAAARDYDRYVARLRAIPAYFAQQTELMREGLRTGFTQPRAALEGLESTIAAHVVGEPSASVFAAPLQAFPPTLPEAERARLRAEAHAAIREAVVPAYRAFLEFFTREYAPQARESHGASELPRGREYYAHLVRSYTTLDLTPEQVHETGLREVERLRGELEAAMRRTGFTGVLSDFVARLRTDPAFYARTAEDLLREAAWIAKRMDGQLPLLFRRLPRIPYGVAPVPAHLAPKYTAGRYFEAPGDGTRAGFYWVNTHALETRPLYTLEALTLHEAVPGHHLQIALQQELTGLRPFRRHATTTAFVEGWALYAERLGLEAGFYQDPHRDFGRLTYEMWRACRLVVDTGLHWMGWSRRQAMEYLAATTALSLHEVRTETDRYISWPGQALAYKTGELKIRELRARAEKALGERFDIRAFHDAVLLNGPVPLDVLEDQVQDFIRRSAGPSPR